MAKIDLNCDLGEGGPYDAVLLSLVTSANVCCGAYAGNLGTIISTLSTAKQLGVRVGAHFGYRDRENFGRAEKQISHDDMLLESTYQIGAMFVLARSLALNVGYIKPHGALYNQAFNQYAPALAVVSAARLFKTGLLGLPESKMETLCDSDGRFVREGFADRRYRPDGSLIARSEPNAMIEDADEAVDQAERLIATQNIRSLCVHGDNPKAVEFVKKLRDRLTARGHEVVPFS